VKLTGLHLLLTYQCNFECDHCFVWGSPWQSGTMTLEIIQNILHQAQKQNTINWIYLEGGEPFLYYPILVKAARIAKEMDFKVGIVSNAYWGTSIKDAIEWLRPFVDEAGGKSWLSDFSISSDLYHYSEFHSTQARNVQHAADQLGIPIEKISIAQPAEPDTPGGQGILPYGESGVMYRGRAAEKLVKYADKKPWDQFHECPFEDLREPGRVHVDPFGNIHICQGITLGNMFVTPLKEICANFDPESHPITGPLLENGPTGLVNRYQLDHREHYADACHLCDEARRTLRPQFPEILLPDQIYGIYAS